MADTMKVRQLKAEDDVVCYIDETSFDTDCTSFEVYPHDTTIQSGSIDADTGLEYKVNVPANMYLGIKIYTYKHSLSDVDIKIDLDDDFEHPVAVSELNKYTNSNKSSLTSDDDPYVFEFTDYTGYAIFTFIYKYKTSGKRIVKIYGKDYFMLRCGGSRNRIVINEQDPSLNTTTNVQPIISRIFERDLKVSSNLVNASSICNGAQLIQRVDIPYEYNFKSISNLANTFKNCKNLLFASCSDGIITKKLQSFGFLFQDCINLQNDISSIYNIFLNGSEDGNYKNIFQKTKISCSDYDKLADVFWNNSTVNVNSALSAFIGCTNLDSSKIPIEWSGNDYAPKSYKDKQSEFNKFIVDTLDGNIIYTASNGYEFTPTSKITSDTLDFQNNTASSSNLSVNYDLIRIMKLGSTITKIQRHGLAKCNNLKSFDGNNANIISVDYAAFYTDGNLEYIKGLENISVLNRNCFNSCSSLTSINGNNEFPEVTAYNNNKGQYHCFSNCIKLSSISFPKMTIAGLLLSTISTLDCYIFRNSAFKKINLPSITQDEYEANTNNWATYIPSGCSVLLSNDVIIVKE